MNGRNIVSLLSLMVYKMIKLDQERFLKSRIRFRNWETKKNSVHGHQVSREIERLLTFVCLGQREGLFRALVTGWPPWHCDSDDLDWVTGRCTCPSHFGEHRERVWGVVEEIGSEADPADKSKSRSSFFLNLNEATAGESWGRVEGGCFPNPFYLPRIPLLSFLHCWDSSAIQLERCLRKKF